MLGRHDEELTATRRVVKTLAAQLTDLSTQVQLIRREPPPPSRTPDTPEPCVNNPPCYSGEPTQCRSFFTQCEVVFSLQPVTYAHERARVAYVISLLTGRARDWGAAAWQAEAVYTRRFDTFKDEMLRVFDRSAHGEEASRLLSSLRQGRRSVVDYSIEFRTLSTICGWNQTTLAARFLEGLSSHVKDEVIARDLPTDLDPLIDLAIRVEKRFDLRRHFRGADSASVAAPTPPISTSVPEPMQLGGLRISAKERERRLVNRLCMYFSQEEPADLTGVPEEYHDLRAVFSRSRVTSLPPHRPYDCSIDLLPGAFPPRAGAGFFFVKKKDGSLRPCIDYRGLNEITVKNRYPLPLMASAFELLQGAKVFTKLDLRNACHLIRIKEGDEWKTAFNTPLGHFEYRVLPFGLVNAPAVFQALINDVLRDMLNVFVFVYLDDILIFSPSLQVHVQHVRRVLQRLLENRLFVKAEKCTFHAHSVTFLGSVISAEGISMDPAKVQAVTEWPIPESRVALQRFLGFANFYRRFIRNFSQVAAPLSALTSVKSSFKWSESAQRAFDQLKHLFTTAPILVTPDVSKQFIVEVDASEVGVGGVLSQRSDSDNKVHPCAYFSHRLSSAERNYDVGDRELLAIRLALAQWRQWLEGSSVPFVVWTDHRNLEYIRSAKRLNARQARWSLFFARFDFRISYRPGSKNVKPDALSRLFDPTDAIPTPREIIPPGRVVGTAVWGIERLVKRALSHSIVPRNVPRNLLFVPVSARSAVFQWAHSSKLTAHPGVRGTLASVRQRFWWPTVERDIRRFVASCAVCAQTKSGHSPPAGLLRPLPIPSRPWSHIGLDFITGLPSSAGNTVILTVVDRFSKSAHFIPLPKLPSAKETAQVLVSHVFKNHGLPSDVVSDRGPQFASLFWKEFCRLIGASVSLSSGFHPQTNGQAERTNQIVGRLLRSLAFQNPSSWVEQLPWAEYAHNSLPSSATGLSPFHCCLGYQPPLFSSQETESNVPSVQAFIRRCKNTWRRVRASLYRSRVRVLRNAKKHRVKSPRYVCGQRVWLSTVNLPLQAPSRKLAPRFIGPFQISKVINPVTVKLRLPPKLRRIHPVFHVSCIKSVVRVPSRISVPPVQAVGTSVYTVHKILDMRRRGRGHQFLVDWEGYGLGREAGFLPGTSWTALSLMNSSGTARTLPRERQEALAEGGGGALS
ncbi:unnamed protein product [Leuciscus chuanchicus]